jgi:DNA-binding transcriptional ArsR family regulator
MDDLDRLFLRVSEYFGLLAEPTRLKLLHALCDGERSVTEIVEQAGASQTNVSRHLNLMHRAGILARRREGNLVYYAVSDPAVVELCRAVCVQIAGRLDDDAAAGRELKRSARRFLQRTGVARP